MGVALVGDLCAYRGPARSIGYRWFTDPATRSLYPPDEHEFYSRLWVSGLRGLTGDAVTLCASYGADALPEDGR